MSSVHHPKIVMAGPGRGFVLLRGEIHKVAVNIRAHHDLLSGLKPKVWVDTVPDVAATTSKPHTLDELFASGGVVKNILSAGNLTCIAPLVAALVAEGGHVKTIPAVYLPLKKEAQSVMFLTTGTGSDPYMVFYPPLQLACVHFNPTTFASSLRIFIVESCEDKYGVVQATLAPRFPGVVTASFPTHKFYARDSWFHYPVLTTWENGGVKWGPLGTATQAQNAPKVDLSVFLPTVAGRLPPSKFKQAVVSLRAEDGKGHGFLRVQVPTFTRDCMPAMVDTVGYLHPQACTTFELSDTSGLVFVNPVTHDDDEDDDGA